MNKKDAILGASLGLLTENGVHATPMLAIVKKAGTGNGNNYNYSPNMGELINLIDQYYISNVPNSFLLITK